MSRADGVNAVTTMIARITQESFEAFLKCPRKSHLVSDGAIGAESDLHDWRRRLEENFKEAASARLRSSRRILSPAMSPYTASLPPPDP